MEANNPSEIQAAINQLAIQLETMSARIIPQTLYTVAECAQILSLSEVTIRRQLKAGKLPHVRVGRSIRIDMSRVL
jgi:excisionase family DNA binding protein